MHSWPVRGTGFSPLARFITALRLLKTRALEKGQQLFQHVKKYPVPNRITQSPMPVTIFSFLPALAPG
jgi:hypothetical protein